jgi:hypothetical protein
VVISSQEDLNASTNAAKPGVPGPPPDATALAKLRDTINLDFHADPLRDVFTFLWEVSDVNLHVMWETLGTVGVSPDRPVTISVRDVPLATVLQLILSDVGKPGQVGYTVKDKVIIVSTTANLGQLERGPSSAAASPEDKAVLAKLDGRIKCALKQVPLRDAILFLRDMTGVTIQADWKAFEAAGIEPAHPVTLRLKDVPARLILNLLLADLPQCRAVYTVKNGTVWVAPAGAAGG